MGGLDFFTHSGYLYDQVKAEGLDYSELKNWLDNIKCKSYHIEWLYSWCVFTFNSKEEMFEFINSHQVLKQKVFEGWRDIHCWSFKFNDEFKELYKDVEPMIDESRIDIANKKKERSWEI